MEYQMAKLLSTANIQNMAMIVGVVIVFSWVASHHIHEIAHMMGLTCYDADGTIVACKPPVV